MKYCSECPHNSNMSVRHGSSIPMFKCSCSKRIEQNLNIERREKFEEAVNNYNDQKGSEKVMVVVDGGEPC